MNAVDLHTHTTESDGTYSPEELVLGAIAAGLRTLAITDHDTMAAYATAAPLAKAAGLELIRGIELTCKHNNSNVHLLGYFFNGDPPLEFYAWLEQMLAARRERNEKLASKLRELGLDIHVEEAERQGRRLTGRPHFARVLVSKGYVETAREAFDRYLGDAGQAFVEREAPVVEEAIAHIRSSGGVSSLAHPTRIRGGVEAKDELFARLGSAGLTAIEVYHSDHSPQEMEQYLAAAQKYGLAVSGGSDFHGANKPGIELGRGINGNLQIPEWVVPGLRARAR